MASRRHQMVATMLDTKGPEVRTGKLEGGRTVAYQKGTEVEITTDYTVNHLFFEDTWDNTSQIKYMHVRRWETPT